MSDQDRRRCRAALLDWMGQANATIAFTGSVRQNLRHPSGTVEWATPPIVVNNAKEFNERLSRRLLTRAVVRRGGRLRYACVVEGGEQNSDKRLHAHFLMSGFPDEVSFNTIKTAMEARWSSSRWGYHDIDVQPLVSDEDRRRWAHYLVKDLGLDHEERWSFNYPYRRP